MLYDKRFRPKLRVALKNGEPFKVLMTWDWLEVTQVLERWADAGQWWRQENEKMFWRVQFEQGQIMEIFQDQVTGEWWLYKVWD